MSLQTSKVLVKNMTFGQWKIRLLQDKWHKMEMVGHFYLATSYKRLVKVVQWGLLEAVFSGPVTLLSPTSRVSPSAAEKLRPIF